MEETVLWAFNARADAYCRGRVCWLGGFGLWRRQQLVLSDVVATLYREVRAIHSRISALSQPMFFPRNRCLRGNCPTAAMLQSIHGGRRIRRATSWAVRIRSQAG
jgi:hypothetical protein